MKRVACVGNAIIYLSSRSFSLLLAGDEDTEGDEEAGVVAGDAIGEDVEAIVF
jgi:hypothetical protein